MTEIRQLKKTDVARLAEALLKAGYAVIAPVKQHAGRQGDLLLYSEIKVPSEVRADGYLLPARSAKEFFLPVTEAVLRYRDAGKETAVEPAVPDTRKRALLFCRPCDAAALAAQEAVFAYQIQDELYLARRRNTAVVTLACAEPDGYCFCSAVGLGPAAEKGSDALLLPDGDGYLVKTLSEKGKKLVEAAGAVFAPAAAGAEDRGRKREAEIASKVTKQLPHQALAKKLDTAFENPFWQDAAPACLGCASCTFLCPVCHCFDVVDEARYGGGVRRRNWDACQHEYFTLHASGHNPRHHKSDRWRQRLMHKFGHAPKRYDLMLCTGCGRCTRVCPVGTDIHEMATRALAAL